MRFQVMRPQFQPDWLPTCVGVAIFPATLTKVWTAPIVQTQNAPPAALYRRMRRQASALSGRRPARGSGQDGARLGAQVPDDA
jgi:hypothetical protein